MITTIAQVKEYVKKIEPRPRFPIVVVEPESYPNAVSLHNKYYWQTLHLPTEDSSIDDAIEVIEKVASEYCD
jgi:hypothetical protein